jgi:hypothetical protein
VSAAGGRDLEAEVATAWDAWELQLCKTVAEHARAEKYRAALLATQAELESALARLAELESAERWKAAG